MLNGYRRAGRGHPNSTLEPGQFTDDTQMMILAGTLLADGRFTDGRYADALRESYERGILRYPDGSVSAACERLLKGLEKSGVNSTTAGCVSIAVPFALAYPEVAELTERVVKACSVTHSHAAAHAAVATVAVLIHETLTGNSDPVQRAARHSTVEDPALGNRISMALGLEKEGISVESAILRVGNDLSVYQTIPLALFLMKRYADPAEILTVAANIGGNADTIGLLCGAYIGALKGKSAIPAELVEELEENRRIEVLGQRLFQNYSKKH
jgi:ADP-ribosylglycohydrolase